MPKKVTEKPVMEKTEKKAPKGDFIFAVGRRKNAIARVRLYSKVKDGLMYGEQQVRKGDIIINEKHASAYFPGVTAKARYSEPLRITNTVNAVAVTVRVEGGGKGGQLDAVVHGISRALSLADKTKNYPILKKHGFLTRDARARQRRNVGTGGKARRQKQSPKR